MLRVVGYELGFGNSIEATGNNRQQGGEKRVSLFLLPLHKIFSGEQKRYIVKSWAIPWQSPHFVTSIIICLG